VVPTTEEYRVEGTLPVDTQKYGTKRQARWREARLPHGGWKKRGPV
jgi:hypothetical protein